VDDCFLLGADVLARCGVEEARPRSDSPIPRGVWREFDPYARPDGASDPELPELLFRGGSIVPLGPAMQFEGELTLNPLTLVVCPAPDGSAEGRLYEDAGEGHAHQDGFFRVSTFRCHREGDELVIPPPTHEGRLHEHEDRHHRHKHPRELEVVVLLDGGRRVARGREDETIRVRG
jgi:alpha-glucosidase